MSDIFNYLYNGNVLCGSYYGIYINYDTSYIDNNYVMIHHLDKRIYFLHNIKHNTLKLVHFKKGNITIINNYIYYKINHNGIFKLISIRLNNTSIRELSVTTYENNSYKNKKHKYIFSNKIHVIEFNDGDSFITIKPKSFKSKRCVIM